MYRIRGPKFPGFSKSSSLLLSQLSFCEKKMNNIIKQAYSLVGAEEQRPKEWYEGNSSYFS
jgi:hypothetical protein